MWRALDLVTCQLLSQPDGMQSGRSGNSKIPVWRESQFAPEGRSPNDRIATVVQVHRICRSRTRHEQMAVGQHHVTGQVNKPTNVNRAGYETRRHVDQVHDPAGRANGEQPVSTDSGLASVTIARTPNRFVSCKRKSCKRKRLAIRIVIYERENPTVAVKNRSSLVSSEVT